MADTIGGAAFSAFFGAVAGLISSIITARLNASKQASTRYVEAITDLVEDIQVSASAYWRKDGRDAALESELKSQLERVEVKLHCLLRYAADPYSARELAADDMWSEITGGAFESDTRTADEPRVEVIRANCKCLVDLIVSL